jgi:hypothetical protein
MMMMMMMMMIIIIIIISEDNFSFITYLCDRSNDYCITFDIHAMRLRSQLDVGTCITIGGDIHLLHTVINATCVQKVTYYLHAIDLVPMTSPLDPIILSCNGTSTLEKKCSLFL